MVKPRFSNKNKGLVNKKGKDKNRQDNTFNWNNSF